MHWILAHDGTVPPWLVIAASAMVALGATFLLMASFLSWRGRARRRAEETGSNGAQAEEAKIERVQEGQRPRTGQMPASIEVLDGQLDALEFALRRLDLQMNAWARRADDSRRVREQKKARTERARQTTRTEERHLREMIEQG